MNHKKYKWLLFDADGTLFDFEKSEAVAFRKSFIELAGYYNEPVFEIYKEINHGMWRDLERGLTTPDRLRIERFQKLAQALSLNIPASEFDKVYSVNLGQCSYLIDGACDMIKKLNIRYNIAIITNGLTSIQRPRFNSSSIKDMIDIIVISEEEGSAKPDSGIFDAAFMKMGKPGKEEVLIIGDSISSDICGGINYGIDVCWYNPLQSESPENINVNYEISRLEDLNTVI
jgi:YjjG family noncanonical pyrimidine nucleotidase